MSIKTVFITGCSSGIGLAAARLFHSKGWNVIAGLRSPSSAPKELSSLEPPSRLLITKCDVTDLKSIESSVEESVKRFGKVDWVVNNAGYGQLGVLEAIPREKVLEQINVNYIGLIDVTRAFLPILRHAAASAEHKGTGIINVSSGAGLWTLPHSSLYCGSKFAVEGFTESLSYELASQDIYAKLVIPHGGISSTAFMQRTGQDMAFGSNEVKQAYEPFMKKTTAAFSRMIAGVATSSDQVAETIYEAATDGSDRLRYLIGDDARGFVKARYGEKGEKADEEYLATLRKYFDYGA